MNWTEFVNLVEFFGVTPDKTGPIVIETILISAVIYLIFLKNIKDGLSKLKYNFGIIASHLSSKTKLDSNLLQVLSPVRLTPLSEEILNESGAKKFIDDNLNEFIKLMDNENPKSALDIQESSYGLMSFALQTKDTAKAVKDFIFNKPIFKTTDGKEIRLDLNTIVTIMGIYFRDRYLEKNPRFNPSDLDETR